MKPNRSWPVEVLLGILAVLAVNRLLDPSQLGWVDLKLHPFWIVVLVAALRYGSGAGAYAGLVASGVVLFLRFRRDGWPVYYEDLLAWRYMELPVAFFCAGWFIGEAVDRLRRRRALADEERDAARRERDHLAGKVKKLEEVTQALRERVARQLSPGALLYQAARRLDALEPEEVQAGALDLIVAQTQATRCSFYALREGRLVCVRRVGWGTDLQTQGNIALSGSVAGRALREQRVVSAREEALWDAEGRVQKGVDVLLAAPVTISGGEAAGVITVEDIPFLQLNAATERILSMIADWTGLSLERIGLVQGLRDRAILDEELEVFTAGYFEESVERQFHHARRTKEPFLVVQVKINAFPFWPEQRQNLVWKGLAQLLSQSLSSTDLVCRHPIRGFLWVLSLRQGAAIEGLEGRIRQIVRQYFEQGDPAQDQAVQLTTREGPGAFVGAASLLQSFAALAAFRTESSPLVTQQGAS